MLLLSRKKVSSSERMLAREVTIGEGKDVKRIIQWLRNGFDTMEEIVVTKKRRKNKMDNLEVIAIDHGWSQMKTVNHVFASGVEEILSEPAFFDDVLEYEERYYKIGTKRDAVMDNKITNDDYYLLTLAAIAKELKTKGKHEARVVLAVGLPATRFGAEKKGFIDYLSRNTDLCFSYEKEVFKIKVEKVAVFPQSYAAVVDQISSFGKKVIVVDIGSWTIDIFPIIDKKPDDANANTISEGLIPCMRRINKHCGRLYNEKIDEDIIQNYIVTKNAGLDDKFVEIMDKALEEFATSLFNSLREEGYSLNTTQFYFVGGGASVMKNFGGIEQKNVRYNLDVKANARGFEKLAKIALARNVRKQ